MNIYDIIKQDHQLVNDLFQELENSNAGGQERAELFRELELLLVPHGRAETETIYAVMADDPEVGDLVEASVDEHNLVESLLGEAQEVIDDDERFMQKLAVLRMNVERHNETEEDEVLVRAEQVIDALQAEALIGEFTATKEEVRARLEEPMRAREGREEAFAPVAR